MTPLLFVAALLTSTLKIAFSFAELAKWIEISFFDLDLIANQNKKRSYFLKVGNICIDAIR